MAESIITTGGVCVLDKNKGKFGFSGVDRAATNPGAKDNLGSRGKCYRCETPPVFK